MGVYSANHDARAAPRATTPRCPDHLDAEAKKEWKRLVPILRRMKVLTEADGMTLANLCQACSTLVKAHKKQTEGHPVQDAKRDHSAESVISDGDPVH
jgi:P27 family predicted phage terminase small subunit